MARVLISMPEKFIREALRTYIHRSKIRENTLATKNASILEALLD